MISDPARQLADGTQDPKERQRELHCGLARNPALPASLVDQLIAVGDPSVWLELADRIDLSAHHIRQLTRVGHSGTVIRLLEHGRLRPDEVDRFDPQIVIAMADIGPVRRDWVGRVAANPDPAIRSAIASTAYLPTDVVAALVDDVDLDVVAEAAQSPRLPQTLARQLAEHPHVSIRRALACNESAPIHVLAELAERRTPDPQLCPCCDGSGHWLTERWSCNGTHADALDDLDYALVLNPRTPAEVLDRFVTHRSTHVRWQLSSRTDLPQSKYRALAQDPIPGIRGNIAGNPAIDADLIRTMGDDPAYDVGRRLAHNPTLPLEILVVLVASTKIGPTLLPRIASATSAEIYELAASTVPAVRMVLAERRDLPAEIIDQLANDNDAKVLKSIAANPALSQAQLRTMLTAHGSRVAARVADNPSCPPDLLIRIARQKPPVQKAFRRIAEHPNAPAEALLACLADHQARVIAASHPALPVETILRLLADTDTNVAAAAAANPSLPETDMGDLA